MQTMMRVLAVTAVCVSLLGADGPNKPAKPRFPAKLQVVSSKPLKDGRHELELNLALEEGISALANPVGDEFFKDAEMKISLTTSDGMTVPADVAYPKPSRVEDIEGIGKSNIFTGTVKIVVRFGPPEKEENLKLTCQLSAWNHRKNACVGGGLLEAEVTLKK